MNKEQLKRLHLIQMRAEVLAADLIELRNATLPHAFDFEISEKDKWVFLDFSNCITKACGLADTLKNFIDRNKTKTDV